MDYKLPVFFPPISNCYSTCSGVASILQAYDRLNPALFLNRIYLFRKSNNVLKYASLEKTNDATVTNCNSHNIKNRVINILQNNKYVFLCLDHYYIKASNYFHSVHFMHDYTLFYGFDLARQVFYCADNFGEGKYLQAEVSFCELEKVWNEVPNSENSSIIVFDYNDSVYINKLNFDMIYLVMEDYANGKYDSVKKMNPTFLSNNIFGFNNGQKCTFETCVFGIKIYDWLLGYLKDVSKMDIRPFHLLMNHQAILLGLIECMQRYNNSFCIQKYADTLNKQINDCTVARNLAIKYNLSQKENIRKRITDIINRVSSNEKIFFDLFLLDRQVWDPSNRQ